MKTLILLLPVVLVLLVLVGQSSVDAGVTQKNEHQNVPHDWSDNWMGP